MSLAETRPESFGEKPAGLRVERAEIGGGQQVTVAKLRADGGDLALGERQTGDRAPGPVDAGLGVEAVEPPRALTHHRRKHGVRGEPLDLGESELAAIAERAMTLGTAFPVDIAAPGEGFNSDTVRSAVVPGAGGVATARALATIWSATVSDNERTRLLNDDIITDMSAEQSAGEPALPFPEPWPRWGSGFMLSSERRPFLTDASFGHDGAGGQVAFADPRHKVGFAYITNDLQLADDQRGVDLVHTLQSLLGV